MSVPITNGLLSSIVNHPDGRIMVRMITICGGYPISTVDFDLAQLEGVIDCLQTLRNEVERQATVAAGPTPTF